MNLCVALLLRRVSCKQYIGFSNIESDSFCLLIVVFSLFVFNVITYIFGFKSTIFLFLMLFLIICYAFLIVFLLFSLFSIFFSSSFLPHFALITFYHCSFPSLDC